MSGWKELLSGRLRAEREAQERAKAFESLSQQKSPKPERPYIPDKEIHDELKRIAEELKFRTMLEDIKRDVWEGRGKITHEDTIHEISYRLDQSYKYSYDDYDSEERIYSTKLATHSTGLRVGVNSTVSGDKTLFFKRYTGGSSLPQIGSCEFPYDDPTSVYKLQNVLLDTAYEDKSPK